MEIKVTLDNGYSIFIEENLNQLNSITKNLKGDKVAIITDSVVDGLYGGSLDSCFTDKQVFTFVFKAGEDSKNGNTYLEILEFLAKNNFQRQDTIVAFGMRTASV